MEPGQAADHAARVGPPARRVQPGEGRDDDAAIAVRHARGERLHVGRRADQAEVVAQPLHERAGHGDGALEHVGRRPLAEAVGDARDQAVRRRHGALAGVEDEEVAGAVGALGLARCEAALPEERRLLIAEQRRQRHAGDLADDAADGPISASSARGTPIASSRPSSHVERVQIHQQRAARIGRVGRVHARRGATPASCRSCRRPARRPRRAPARPAARPAATRASGRRSTSRAAGPSARGSGRSSPARPPARRCACPARRSHSRARARSRAPTARRSRAGWRCRSRRRRPRPPRPPPARPRCTRASAPGSRRRRARPSPDAA